ncbi:proline-rich protein 33 isoform 1-T2 [Anomaloglossus baeobatrachus]|uniref:proline-rich protein 33 n=1 Tax=Anomaloglossus baeobatrachus TaxID=238106 RepID=UPI003F4F4611
MLLTVTPLENPGPPSPAPPPTPPKPRKDNAKLQRLLRKAAKKSAVQASPTLATKSYRATLSPVSEADLEINESAAPQKHKRPPSITLPPRFQFKAVTHRAPSPYPKQKFTFTVSEQQSLNQYLSLSPVPDTPSPLPFRPSSPSLTFLYPQGGNTPDRLSPRVITNSSPRPCTPKAIETTPKQPIVPQNQILSPPTIIVQETNGNNAETVYPKIDETVNEIQINGFSTPICEDTNLPKGSSYSRSIPDHQEPTYQTNSCNPSSEKESKLSVSTKIATEVTDRKEIVHKLSKVVEIPHGKSPKDARPTVNSTDYPDGQSKVTVKTEVTISPKTTGAPKVTSSMDNSPKTELVPKSEETSILKSPDKPKPPRKKPGGGWARLVKHLVVEPEEPKFPEAQNSKEDKSEKSEGEKRDSTEGTQQSKTNRANKMWDALLYRMATSSKEPEKPGQTAPPPLPFFRTRLPLLLNRPRFDARKLKEAAARPLRRVTAFFHRRVAEKEKETSSSFNRTASGWSIRGEDDKQEDGKKAVDGDKEQ